MAIALDGAVVSVEQDATEAFTVGDNPNRLMLVAIGTHQAASASGVTYNGDAMTLLKRQAGSFEEHCEIWGMLAPDVGTANVVVSGANNYWAMGIYSLYNVLQSALPSVTAGATAGSGSATASLDTPSDGCWVVGVVSSEPVPTLATTGGVEDWAQSGQSFENTKGAHVIKATAGTQAMTWTESFGGRWQVALVAVEPAADPVVGFNMAFV